MTTANGNASQSNEAQNNEGNGQMSEVSAQNGDKSVENTAEALKNTSWAAFQNTCDQIAKDLKTDTEELQMIASMLPVEDQFSVEMVEHLIKGDKVLYAPAKRKNAAVGKETKPSASNQQRACLTLMLPHYATWQKEKAQRIVDFAATLEAETIERAKQAKRKMTPKQKLAFFDSVTVKVQDKNANKSFADRKIEAIEKMFARALPKAYYLRKISAEGMTVNVERKTCTYTGFDYATKQVEGNTVITLSSDKSEITETLAELQQHASIFTGYYKVTASRSTGKLSKAEKQAAASKAAAAINPVDTAANNAKEMSKHIEAVQKDSKTLALYRKQQGPKVLFDTLFASLFVTDKELDITALQLAIDHAMAKAKIARKLQVVYGSDLPKDAVA